ncbi:MAG TPA: hypothetical protein VLL48_06080, partial [Longimicrobiales bacterium]|nr:hypothetical protein [Longimicrobiales bacterium]
MPDPSTTLDPDVARSLTEGRCAAPFDVLGVHPHPDGGQVVRAFVPGARAVAVVPGGGGDPLEMAPTGTEGLFELRFPGRDGPFPYRLAVTRRDGSAERLDDPYRFTPTVDEERVRAFLRGEERRVHEVLGARLVERQGVEGTAFAVWAPHARAVSLIGEMNGWDPRRHPMRPRGDTGVWELFVPGVGPGARYKYQVVT